MITMFMNYLIYKNIFKGYFTSGDIPCSEEYILIPFPFNLVKIDNSCHIKEIMIDLLSSRSVKQEFDKLKLENFWIKV